MKKDYFKDYPESVKKNIESMPKLKAKIILSNEMYEFMDRLINESRDKFIKKYPKACPEPIIYNCIKPY